MSDAASAKPVGNMGTVTILSGNGQLTANWTAVFGADQYDVYYSATNTIPGSSSQTVSTTTATITGLTNGTTYYVWVKPKNANGAGNTNTVVNGVPLGTPGAPTVTPAYKQLLVTWTAVAGADEYEVYYGTSSTPTTLAATTAGTTATITGLTNGTTYYVRLRAKNANGVSDYGPSVNQAPGLTPGLYRGAEKIGNQNLADSLTFISTNAVNGDDFYIVLGADESSPPKTLDYSGKTVGISLSGYNSERKITLNANGGLFNINSGVTLILDENITLVGLSTNNNSLVQLNNNSKLIMNDGARISGNIVSKSEGGGVCVSDGTFTMTGGEISGNTAYTGGGVYMSDGTFTMTGGEISGNTTGSDGGGVCMTNGTFTMNGGKISGNTASTDLSWVTIYGGGVYVYGGTFIKSGGGTITGYASDTVNGNVVKKSSVVQNNVGHTVYVNQLKRRETTAGPGANMDSRVIGTAGGWIDIAPLMLSANTWIDGNITTSGGEQWFKFIATDFFQKIQVNFGTLSDLYVHVYDSSGATKGSETNLYNNKKDFSIILNVGQEYYVRVLPYSSSRSGTYQITLDALSLQPVSLAANTWTDGNITTSGDEQWFKFTATASKQYLHISIGTLGSLYVQLYDSGGTNVGSSSIFSNTGSNYKTVTSGQEYYIKVWSLNPSGNGTYQIAINESSTPP
jgi:hypothetical protein